jgi:hypothetical protein
MVINCYFRHLFFVYHVVTWSRHEEKVNILYLFGEYVLSADIKGNIYIWTFKGAEPNSEPVGSMSLGDKFTPTCIMLWRYFVLQSFCALCLLGFDSRGLTNSNEGVMMGTVNSSARHRASGTETLVIFSTHPS